MLKNRDLVSLYKIQKKPTRVSYQTLYIENGMFNNLLNNHCNIEVHECIRLKYVLSYVDPSRDSSQENMNLSTTRKHYNGATKPCTEYCLQNNAFPSRKNTMNVCEMCGMMPQIWNKSFSSPNRSLKWRKASSNEKLAQKSGFQSLPLLHPATLHNVRKSCADEDGWSLA